MDRPVESTIEVSVPGGSADLISNVTQQLVTELNRDIGPVASHVSEKGAPGTKGDVVSLGQIALALISAGVTKQIAQALVQYIKRNPRITVRVGKIEVTKEYASKDDVTVITSLVKELSAKTPKPA